MTAMKEALWTVMMKEMYSENKKQRMQKLTTHSLAHILLTLLTLIIRIRGLTNSLSIYWCESRQLLNHFINMIHFDLSFDYDSLVNSCKKYYLNIFAVI